MARWQEKRESPHSLWSASQAHTTVHAAMNNKRGPTLEGIV